MESRNQWLSNCKEQHWCRELHHLAGRWNYLKKTFRGVEMRSNSTTHERVLSEVVDDLCSGEKEWTVASRDRRFLPNREFRLKVGSIYKLFTSLPLHGLYIASFTVHNLNPPGIHKSPCASRINTKLISRSPGQCFEREEKCLGSS